MSQKGGGAVRVELLGRSVRVDFADESEPLELDNDTDRWLAIELLWAAHHRAGNVSTGSLTVAVGLTDDSLRQRVHRLRKRGLPITNQRSVGYRWDAEGVTVDAFDFLQHVAAGRGTALDATGARTESYQLARHLWRGGLPLFDPGRFPRVPAPELYTEVADAERLLRDHGQRILVIDDEIADRLRLELEPFHECMAIASFDEYRRLDSAALESFDLVVVDRFLSDDVDGPHGEVIVRDINERALGLPVCLITKDPPRNTNVGAWLLRLGLAGLILKDSVPRVTVR